MSIGSDAAAALAEIVSAHADCTVTLVNGDSTATGIRSTRRGEGALEQAGYEGRPLRSVYVKASEIGTVLQGYGLTVDGVRVQVVTTPEIDPAASLMRIDYVENTEQ